MADDTYTLAIGLVKSVKLESSELDSQIEVHEPTLVINVDRGQTGCIEQPIAERKLFTVPVHTLKTPRQCQHWIMRSLWSAQLILVASEIGNPKVLLKELIWKMKEKWEAGEVCTGVVEMDVTRVARGEFRRMAVEMWVNDMSGEFEGESSDCCAVCLDVIDEKSIVLELPCRHVFHCGCIAAWLARKSNCPCCRSRVQVSYKFWVHKKNECSL